MVDLAVFQKPVAAASPAVEVNNSAQFVSFWHAAFGYPTKTAFIRNIRNGNISVDNLTANLVGKHFSPSPFTSFGHLDATRSNIKSTKQLHIATKSLDHKRPLLWTSVHESSGRLHSDQTRQLPVLGRHRERFLAIFI